MKRFTLLLVVAAACGGSEKPTTTPPTTGGEDHGKEHDKLTPELNAFHDILSPRWHADKGEARMKDTCGAVADFQAKAAAVKSSAAPAGATPESWTEAGTHLETSVTGLSTACTATDLAAFEVAFEDVHNAFHHAMELVMGKHDMKHPAETGGHGDHH